MKLDKEKLESLTGNLIKWTKESIESTGGKKAIIGISGGKDSSVVAALCVKAFGKENVIGVLMPDGVQSDISYSREFCSLLGIKSIEINIKDITNSIHYSLNKIDSKIIPEISNQAKVNIPPRVRMTLLYAVSQSIDDSRVINTSNISEDWVGYATIYGDTAGAISPLGMLTSDEVIQVGEYLGLPDKFLSKVPSDGLTGKTDEDNFGFSYEVLNKYIREGVIEDPAIKEKIDRMHRISRFKFLPIPMFPADLPIKADDIAGVYTSHSER
ncbi:NAD(+) synthase [Tissierella sp. Yu-01]|uniref:NAD(+) synthase n=1 Tax=Tissierella sp. Yu-01 TaxID=3035694 RepID=UPI00240E29DA|nr:NAD(+) synthase [Tissierella sp. Yu-01]WFA08714.1 NAD(+) synthase [Tissierella sp. Yu-01]